ncbi:MAG: preprotein translocase subunit SecA [Patescibacteria group bacterium]|nr:preprotein translocase subunit SecA [Patescibacteria group bacterium]
MSFFSKIFGDPNEKYLKRHQPIVEEINMLEPKFERFSKAKLKEKTKEFKERLQKGETLDTLLPEVFALVREAAKRTLKQRHFDVQLIGGIVLHQGKIAEMKTGEGKTLAATLAVYLNALTEKGVHIVTVNDYLAKRDTVWMGQIYHALGLSVGCIVHEAAYLYEPEYRPENSKFQNPKSKQTQNSKLKTQNSNRDKERDLLGSFKVVESYLRPVPRKEAYGADITYGTNNEFGFDYLRDNMALGLAELVQRDLNFAIVDEIDSVLIDEARTPLIISQPDYESSRYYQEFSRIIPQLKENIDYNIEEKEKSAFLTEQGIDKIEKILRVSNIYTEKGQRYLHHLEQALRSQVFFKRDRDYIVKAGKVIIVDEFTGRLMPGRRWSGGLHQAIEAKEGVEVLPESRTLATITFQNYFRQYKKLAGMTGTAATSAEEFDKVYGLDVILVPTNKPMIREDLPDRVYKTEFGKFKAIIEEVKKRHQKGQPILIGTTSIEKNEYLARLLSREGINCQILNAKHHEREGEIIAQAGREGQVTVATNMAGRGVDIILGGNPPTFEQARKVKEVGGLYVIGAQRHEARRIDNQLRGRAGRQGDPGTSQFFISLEDDILRIFGGERIKNLMEFLKLPEDQPIEAKILSGAIEKAQTQVEGLNFDLRKHILEYDDVIAKHRNKIYFLRKEILKKDYQGLCDFVLGIIEKEIERIIALEQEDGFNFEEIFEEIKTIMPLPDGVHFKLREFSRKEEIFQYLKNLAKTYFAQKEEKEGRENLEKILRFVCLRTIDIFWQEHLETMDYLKESVRLRVYGGKDPLVEYKSEGHRIFQKLENLINSQIARTIFKLTIKT